MKINDVGTLFAGTDRYALQVVEMVNEKTAVAVHIKNDGTCFHFFESVGESKGFPWVEILRRKNNGKWCDKEGFEFVVGNIKNYQDQSF